MNSEPSPTETTPSETTPTETTQSLCPVCKALIDALIIEEAGKVYMTKSCAAHGSFKVLLSSDAAMYWGAHKYNKPGQHVKAFQTIENEGCPFDCGICPEHQQHACVGVIEITQNCNMQCPTCFSSSHPGHATSLSLQEIEKAIDTLVEAEGQLEILQISGGEPTVHPQILDILKLARTKNVKHVMLNTNGQRIAHDKNFVKALKEVNPSDSPSIYFQFDGFKEQTHLILRGQANLLETKLKALKNLKEHEISVMLVTTLRKNVNVSEAGDILRLVMENEHINGVVFQPTFFAGRHQQQERLTIPDVIDSLVDHPDSILEKSDFFPIPCCYPGCSTVTYLFVDGDEIRILPREIDLSYYLDYFTNTTVPDIEQITREALEGLYSAGAVTNSDTMLENFCTACSLSFSLPELKNKVKAIFIQPFMDAWNFDVRRAKKCCVMEALPDGKIIPFCVYNSLYRNNGHDRQPVLL